MTLESHFLSRIQSAVPDLKAVYLYGSRALGKARPDSDYDVAVLAASPLEGKDVFFRLQLELAGLTDSGVNLVDLQSLPIVLQFEVLRGRKRLFCADRAFCVDFEAEILSDYQRFAQERQVILEVFLKKRADAGRQQIGR
ncbi:MAG: nucleotidyltransferase domain-containing protein [Phycisphaerae bacterium]|nr:nucleotidyltransferase domain-containing protein [Saprospiraceae bacterium]